MLQQMDKPVTRAELISLFVELVKEADERETAAIEAIEKLNVFQEADKKRLALMERLLTREEQLAVYDRLEREGV